MLKKKPEPLTVTTSLTYINKEINLSRLEGITSNVLHTTVA